MGGRGTQGNWWELRELLHSFVVIVSEPRLFFSRKRLVELNRPAVKRTGLWLRRPLAWYFSP